MPANATPVRFEEYEINDASGGPRVGVYAPVYARLLAIALEDEEAAKTNPEHKRRGLKVHFSSRDAGLFGCERMQQWATEDGWCIVRGKAAPDGTREVDLERVTDEEGEAE